MIQLADSLGLRSQKPNFTRDSYDTLTALRAVQDHEIDEGHIAYCAATGLHYEYKYSNTVDDRTGKWREYKPVDVEITEDSENPVQSKAISKKMVEVWNNFNTLKGEIQKVEGMATMDEALNDQSIKGVQNKTLKKEFDIIGNRIASLENGMKNYVAWTDVESEVKEESQNPVNGGTLYTELSAIKTLISNLTARVDKVEPVDAEFSATSEKPVQNKVLKAKFDAINQAIEDLEGDLEENISSELETINETIEGIQGDIETIEGRLDNVEPVDTALNNTSTKPVQNKVVKEKFDEVDSALSTLKGRVDKVEPVDTAFSTTSEMPLQNKVITTKLNSVDSQISNIIERLNDVEPADGELSTTSEKPVQNKVIASKFDRLEKLLSYYIVVPIQLEFDASPIVVPVGESTKVTYTWNASKLGDEDVDKDCEFKIDEDEVSNTTRTKDYTINEASYKVITKTLTCSYNDHDYLKDVTIYAVPYSYCGGISTVGDLGPSEAEIKGLTKYLQSDNKGEISIDLSSECIVYAYPAIFGELSSVKDQNGFEYLGTDGSFGKATTSVNGQSYYVYWLKSPVTVNKFKFIFS